MTLARPVVLAVILVPGVARADDEPGRRAGLQYGAAFTAETRVRSGDICPRGSREPCILGSGGGMAIRVGHRAASGVFLGGAYEFSKHDSSNILNLAILQQVRGELRFPVWTGDRVSPFLHLGAGGVAYGNQWRPETYGAVLSFGPGIAMEVTPEVFAGLMPAYRVMWFREWRDGAGQERPDGAAHFIGLELTLEARSAFARY